jgi:CMP-N-acetylneuraminic acid synthetase
MNSSNNSVLSKDTIFEASNHTNINLTFNTTSSLEDISVAKAKEALQKMLNKNSSSLFSVTKRVEV